VVSAVITTVIFVFALHNLRALHPRAYSEILNN
jgi:hypothetical protein